MYRYIALIWNKADTQKAEVSNFIRQKIHSDSTRWKNIHDQNSLIIFHAGEYPGRMQATPLKAKSSQRGVILGQVFRRKYHDHDISKTNYINDTETLEILKSEGRHLSRNYWGRYVAFISDPEQKTTYIMRDPTGAFPCLFTNFHGIDIYFSDINDLVRIIPLKTTINQAYLSAYLKYEFMQNKETGLENVTKLLPGQCHKITKGKTTSFFHWNPEQIYRDSAIEDPTQAAELLHQVTLDSVTAWASRYKTIIHRLSGGLDSSILLSCLTQTKQPLKITSLNYFTSSLDGDERRYARLAAKEAHCELLEKRLTARHVNLEKILHISKSAEPESYLFAIDRGSHETHLAKKNNIEAIFSGHGGDNIFFQPGTYMGVLDYREDYGLQSGLFRVAMEAARLEQKSIWAILYKVLRHSTSKRSWHPLTDFFPEYNALLNLEILRSVNDDDILHPWVKEAKSIPPGKLLHLMLATVSPLYYEPSLSPRSQLEPVNPLFSQPLIELCLQIPTYTLTTGGRDRGLARLAFKNNVITEIINRESKGAGDQYYTQVFEGNIKFIREFLMDGILMKEKIMNGQALEQALSGDQTHIDAARLHILSLICTESWLQHWTSRKLSGEII